MTEICTTLNRIRACLPSYSSWTKLLRNLGKTKSDDEPLPLSVILDSNGLDDAIWCLRATTGYDRECRLFAVWCARQVQHLNTDQRVGAAIQAAEDFANGLTDAATMATARYAAIDAAWAARGTAAMNAALAAAEAARIVARDATKYAASCYSIAATLAATRDTARAAGVATLDAQEEAFRWIVTGGLHEWENKHD